MALVRRVPILFYRVILSYSYESLKCSISFGLPSALLYFFELRPYGWA